MFSFFRKEKERPKHEVLNAVKAFDTYQDHSYEDETKEAVETFQQRLKNAVDEIIEIPDNSYMEKVELITKEAVELSLRISKAKVQIEECKLSMRSSVEKGLQFVQSTNFYPPEYVFHINKIEGFITDLTEIREKNPLKSLNEFFEFRTQVEQDIQLFTELHQETIELIDKIDQKMTQKQKNETQNILEIKESLFRAIQMGELLRAKSDLKKLKKEYKRF